MCDQDHYDDDLKEYKDRAALSRRQFGALSLGVGAAFLLPRSADAQSVTEKDVSIKTPDGTCDAYFVHPAKPAAAVLIWPDIIGLRPAFRQMGKRLAESGYAVLVVNPFYRVKPAPVVPDGSKFSDPETRKVLIGFAGSINPPANQTSDAKAFIAWLDAQPQVDKSKKIGTTGYCMGGPIVFRTAAAVPNRVGAVGSFHGGGLTTKAPESPHLLIPQTNASYLIAIADNDDKREPESKNILRQAFDAAKKDAEIEVYPAAHGWCPPDAEVYDQKQAEKAWSRMLEMFKKSLA
jgi:carboxymethylenebutenolidase